MKIVLTSSSQVLALISSHPALREIGALANLVHSSQAAAMGKPCCGRQAPAVPQHTKIQIEQALSGLSDADFQSIKRILNLSTLCYYKTVNNQLEQVCI